MLKKNDHVAVKLEREILSGVYKPGDRLPPERELAEKYQVSRSILRESIRHLAGLGLLRTEPQSGTYVTDYRKEASLEFLIYLLDNNETLDREIFQAVNEFREILEAGCAEKAALKGGPEKAVALRAILEEMKERREDPAALAAADYRFHACFVEQTENLALRILFNACKSVYLFYTEVFYGEEENAEVTFGQLERFIGAIARREPGEAAAALKEALDYGRDKVYRSLNL